MAAKEKLTEGINFRVTESSYRQYKAMAKAKNLGVNTFVREYLEEQLRAEAGDLKVEASVDAPSDGSAQLSTDVAEQFATLGEQIRDLKEEIQQRRKNFAHMLQVILKAVLDADQVDAIVEDMIKRGLLP